MSKMIELAFIAGNRDVIIFRIEGKTITYLDRNWPHGLKIMPLSATKISALKNSRNQSMKRYAILIEEANSGKSLEEYEQAKTEEDLAEIIRKDSKLNGLVEVKK